MTRPIDATALTEQIKKLCYDEYMANWLRVLIDNQPTIKTEPIEVPRPIRHGKWKQWDGYGYEDTYECTECGEPFVLIEGTPLQNGYNYCPNCGARMDGEKEERKEE